jgi:anti-anti-sigma factor
MINDTDAPLENDIIVPHFDDEKDEMLKIQLQRIEDVPGCLVLYLSGIIDGYNVNYFRKRVDKAIEAGFIRLIFDLSGLNYVDFLLESLTAFLKAVKPQGGDLVLVEMPPKICGVLQLLGFFQFSTFKENLSEAVSFFAAR